MDATVLNDPYLEDFIAKYDRWIEDGKIPHAARVIPIAKSLPGWARGIPGGLPHGVRFVRDSVPRGGHRHAAASVPIGKAFKAPG